MDFLTRSEAAEETVYKFQRLGFSKLTESGKMEKMEKAERQIIPLMPPSELVSCLRTFLSPSDMIHSMNIRV